MSDIAYKPFFDATCEVFHLLLDLDASEIGQNDFTDIADDDDRVNIHIGIIGDLKGEIIYRFPKNTTLEMVKIMSGMEIEEIDDFVTSAMGEIANIISGNAVTGLTKQKIICDIEPPKVILGKIFTDNRKAPVITSVHTAVGDVELHIYL